MAETNNQKPADPAKSSEENVAPSRFQNFVSNHPRAAKVAAVTGAIGTAVGGVLLVRTVKSNKDHLNSAAEHAGAALDEVTASVDPAS